MSPQYRYIESLDVLILRGNKLFGDPGSYGESLVPPWPSVAAGAIRSRMLADKQLDISAFSRGDIQDAELGTPEKPGPFTLAGFYLARLKNGEPEILVAPPDDMIISKAETGVLNIHAMEPQAVHGAMASSFPLPRLPVLPQADRGKPESGYWLTQHGWAAYLQGKIPAADQLVHTTALWQIESRAGIGMNAQTRSVEEGKLFTTQTVVMKGSVGFVAVISGAQPPENGLLRFGGDGRAATIRSVNVRLPEPDYTTIAKTGRCKILLTWWNHGQTRICSRTPCRNAIWLGSGQSPTQARTAGCR